MYPPPLLPPQRGWPLRASSSARNNADCPATARSTSDSAVMDPACRPTMANATRGGIAGRALTPLTPPRRRRPLLERMSSHSRLGQPNALTTHPRQLVASNRASDSGALQPLVGLARPPAPRRARRAGAACGSCEPRPPSSWARAKRRSEPPGSCFCNVRTLRRPVGNAATLIATSAALPLPVRPASGGIVKISGPSLPSASTRAARARATVSEASRSQPSDPSISATPRWRRRRRRLGLILHRCHLGSHARQGRLGAPFMTTTSAL